MTRPQAAPRADTAAERWFQWTEPAGAATGRHRATAPVVARRRRAQHFARRRRDLLVDTVLALVLALILMSLTAGLGILLLVVLPMAAGLIARRIMQRGRARRRGGPTRRDRRSRAARARPGR